MLNLIDTHCHIHGEEYNNALAVLKEGEEAGVASCICVGTDLVSSKNAVKFSQKHSNHGVYSSVGIHPHEAIEEKIDDVLSDQTWQELEDLAKQHRVVAIGEFGFDFFYHKEEEARAHQTKLARKHLELATKLNLPVILHIRDAFQPFFELITEFPNIRGVIHSFSDTPENLEKVLKLPNNFYIGLNGIMTFSKSPEQLQAAKDVPLSRLVLETDSPYLTPPPERGKINSIKNTKLIAEFLSDLRGENLEHFCASTTANAKELFSI